MIYYNPEILDLCTVKNGHYVVEYELYDRKINKYDGFVLAYTHDTEALKDLSIISLNKKYYELFIKLFNLAQKDSIWINMISELAKRLEYEKDKSIESRHAL